MKVNFSNCDDSQLSDVSAIDVLTMERKMRIYLSKQIFYFELTFSSGANNSPIKQY